MRLPTRALLLALLPLLGGLTFLPPGATATDLRLSRALAIHYSHVAIWGDDGGGCVAGFADQRTLPATISDVCVDVVFSKWQGYHKGRVTLIAPSGLSKYVSFHGTSGRHIVRDFSLSTGFTPGTWTVTVRVDGRQVTSTTFTVLAPTETPTPIPTQTPRPTSTPVPTATSTPRPVPTSPPTSIDGQGLMLSADVFAPAQPSAQPWGVVDAAGANASYFAHHMHRVSYDALGFRSGAYQQADWNDDTPSEVEFRYLGGIYTDASAAARAWQDGVDTLQTGWNASPVNCQTAATGAKCAEGMYWTSTGLGETYVVAQYNQCTLEVLASYNLTGASQGGEIIRVVNAITAAAQQAAARVCGWSAVPVATTAPFIPLPPPTAVPYIPPSSSPTAVRYATPTPYPYYSPPPGGQCNDYDNDDEGKTPGSNDYDYNGCH